MKNKLTKNQDQLITLGTSYRQWNKKYGKKFRKALKDGDVVALTEIPPPPSTPPPPDED